MPPGILPIHTVGKEDHHFEQTIKHVQDLHETQLGTDPALRRLQCLSPTVTLLVIVSSVPNFLVLRLRLRFLFSLNSVLPSMK